MLRSNHMSARLWEKGESIDAAVHAFTVGDDPIVDRSLVAWDALASAAHARMLASIGIMQPEDVAAAVTELRAVFVEGLNNTFVIPPELEDCHTAIENRLVAKLGEAGKRVHAGRSRNDQVLVASRLWLKNAVMQRARDMLNACAGFTEQARDTIDIPLPGHTHMQAAMPACVGMWFHAFAEWLLQLARDALTLLNSIDSNPLGVGSGFGVSLDLDRSMTTQLLGFARVQRSPIDVQNSRGRMELKYLSWCCEVAQMLEKLSWDLILFSSREFGYCKLPLKFTTGSSIMPQKRNPDVLELIRGSGASIRAARTELELVIAKLPSNYHRDFQLTKAPTLRGDEKVHACLLLLPRLASEITWERPRLEAEMTDDLYATYETFRLVKAGMTFRDAYQEVARRLAEGTFVKNDLAKEFEPIRETAKTELTAIEGEAKALSDNLQRTFCTFHSVQESVFDVSRLG